MRPEPMKMPFGLGTLVDPGNQLLDGSPDSHGKGNFEGEGAADCPSVICAKTAELMVMLWLWAQTGPGNHKLDGGPDSRSSRGNGQFRGKGHPL